LGIAPKGDQILYPAISGQLKNNHSQRPPRLAVKNITEKRHRIYE
jgi:hypothetical protein